MYSTSPNLDSAWKEWYRLKHKDAYTSKSGESFETYVSDVLEKLYPDFLDPDPMGRLGDGGCDGLANKGQLFLHAMGSERRPIKMLRQEQKSRATLNTRCKAQLILRSGALSPMRR